MEMLPSSFLAVQQRQDFRDVVNFLHGFISRSQNVTVYLEPVDGEQKGKKLNYRNSERTILALWILRNDFRLELFDPQLKLESDELYEVGAQFESKGWRNYKFNPLDPAALSTALRLIDHCVQAYP